MSEIFNVDIIHKLIDETIEKKDRYVSIFIGEYGVTIGVYPIVEEESPMVNDMCFGNTFFFDRKVYLNEKMDDARCGQTLRHELTHAFIFETQANSDDNASFTEETVCNFIGLYGSKIEEIAERYMAQRNTVVLR